MEWYEILLAIFAGAGGIGGLIAIYKAKPERRAIEIENLIKSMNQDRKSAAEYRNQSERMIDRLRLRIERVEKKDKIYYNSIMAAYRCRSVTDMKDCPVISTLDQLCDKNENVCDINI